VGGAQFSDSSAASFASLEICFAEKIGMNFFLNGFKSIAEAFAKDLGIWWFLAPILILWIASQFY
jgi:hypothetical protein